MPFAKICWQCYIKKKAFVFLNKWELFQNENENFHVFSKKKKIQIKNLIIDCV